MKRAGEQKIGGLLKEFLRTNGLEEEFMNHLILREWDKCVGEKVAELTVNKYFKDGVLYCSIGSSMVRSQLVFRKDMIIGMINSKIGSDLVKDIRLL